MFNMHSRTRSLRRATKVVRSLLAWVVIVAMLVEMPLTVAAQANVLGGLVSQRESSRLPDIGEWDDGGFPAPDTSHLDARLLELEEQRRALEVERASLFAAISQFSQVREEQRQQVSELDAQQIALYAMMLQEPDEPAFQAFGYDGEPLISPRIQMEALHEALLEQVEENDTIYEVIVFTIEHYQELHAAVVAQIDAINEEILAIAAEINRLWEEWDASLPNDEYDSDWEPCEDMVCECYDEDDFDDEFWDEWMELNPDCCGDCGFDCSSCEDCYYDEDDFDYDYGYEIDYDVVPDPMSMPSILAYALVPISPLNDECPPGCTGTDECGVWLIYSDARFAQFLAGTLGANYHTFILTTNVTAPAARQTGRPGVFTGVFDGGGHTVTNLMLGIGANNETGIGMVRSAGGAAVFRNITFNNTGTADGTRLYSTSNTTAARLNQVTGIGIIAGRTVPYGGLASTVSIYNVHLTGIHEIQQTSGTTSLSTAQGANDRIGGLVGQVDPSSTLNITDVSINDLRISSGVTGADRGWGQAGGLVGRVQVGGALNVNVAMQQTNSIRVTTTHTGVQIAGGILGFQDGGHVFINNVTVEARGAGAHTGTGNVAAATLGVRARQNAGGIVGLTTRTGTLTIAHATVDVHVVTIFNSGGTESVDGRVGGIVGIGRNNITISDTVNNAAVWQEGSASGAAGIIGYTGSASRVTLNRVTNNGNVIHTNGTGPLGGIIARSRGSLFFTDVTNNGTVRKSSGSATRAWQRVGGIIGRVQQLNNSRIEFTRVTNNGTVNFENSGTVAANGANGVGGIFGHIHTGRATSRITLIEITNTGTIDIGSGNSAHHVGGIIGHNQGVNLTIDGVINTGNIVGPANHGRNFGGIIGLNTGQANNTRINNAVNTGSVTAGNGNYAGGIIGRNIGRNLQISNAVNHGDIGTRPTAGGIIGRSGGGSAAGRDLRLTNVTNFATVTGNQNAGGIIGQVRGRNSRIEMAINYGEVRATTSGSVMRVGGIVGMDNAPGFAIRNAGNFGFIGSPSGMSAANSRHNNQGAGGIIGRSNSANNTLDAVFNQGVVTGGVATGGIVGRTTRGIFIRDFYNIGTVRGMNAVNGAGVVGRRTGGNVTVQRGFVSAQVRGLSVGGSGSSASGGDTANAFAGFGTNATNASRVANVFVDQSTLSEFEIASFGGAAGANPRHQANRPNAARGITLVDTELLTFGVLPGISPGPTGQGLWRTGLVHADGSPVDPDYLRTFPFFAWQVDGGTQEVFFDTIRTPREGYLAGAQVMDLLSIAAAADVVTISGLAAPMPVAMFPVGLSAAQHALVAAQVSRSMPLRVFMPYGALPNLTPEQGRARMFPTIPIGQDVFEISVPRTSAANQIGPMRNPAQTDPIAPAISIGVINTNGVVGFETREVPDRVVIRAVDNEWNPSEFVNFAHFEDPDIANPYVQNFLNIEGLLIITYEIDNEQLLGISYGPTGTLATVSSALGYHVPETQRVQFENIETGIMNIPLTRIPFPIRVWVRLAVEDAGDDTTGSDGDGPERGAVITNSVAQRNGAELTRNGSAAGTAFFDITDVMWGDTIRGSAPLHTISEVVLRHDYLQFIDGIWQLDLYVSPLELINNIEVRFIEETGFNDAGDIVSVRINPALLNVTPVTSWVENWPANAPVQEIRGTNAGNWNVNLTSSAAAANRLHEYTVFNVTCPTGTFRPNLGLHLFDLLEYNEPPGDSEADPTRLGHVYIVMERIVEFDVHIYSGIAGRDVLIPHAHLNVNEQEIDGRGNGTFFVDNTQFINMFVAGAIGWNTSEESFALSDIRSIVEAPGGPHPVFMPLFREMPGEGVLEGFVICESTHRFLAGADVVIFDTVTNTQIWAGVTDELGRFRVTEEMIGQEFVVGRAYRAVGNKAGFAPSDSIPTPIIMTANGADAPIFLTPTDLEEFTLIVTVVESENSPESLPEGITVSFERPMQPSVGLTYVPGEDYAPGTWQHVNQNTPGVGNLVVNLPPGEEFENFVIIPTRTPVFATDYDLVTQEAHVRVYVTVIEVPPGHGVLYGFVTQATTDPATGAPFVGPGNPIAGATVSLPGFENIADVTTDARGFYFFPAVPVGRTHVIVRAEGYNAKATTTPVLITEGNATNRDFALTSPDETAILYGRVYCYETGVSVPGAVVTVTPVGAAIDAFAAQSTAADDNGIYVFSGLLRNSSVTITVNEENFEPFTATQAIGNVSSVLRDIPLLNFRGVYIHVRVTNGSTQELITGAEVRLFLPGGGSVVGFTKQVFYPGGDRVDSEGNRYTIEAIFPVHYTRVPQPTPGNPRRFEVLVQAGEEFRLVHKEIFVAYNDYIETLEGLSPRKRVEIELATPSPREAILWGRVTDSITGDGIAGAIVWPPALMGNATDPREMNEDMFGISNYDGYYFILVDLEEVGRWFPGLNTVTVTYVASATGYRSEADPVVLDLNRVNRHDFELEPEDEPTYVLFGTVTGVAGPEPIPGATVRVNIGPGQYVYATTCHMGGYAITGMERGTYSAIATHPGYGPHRVEEIVVDGNTRQDFELPSYIEILVRVIHHDMRESGNYTDDLYPEGYIMFYQYLTFPVSAGSDNVRTINLPNLPTIMRDYRLVDMEGNYPTRSFDLVNGDASIPIDFLLEPRPVLLTVRHVMIVDGVPFDIMSPDTFNRVAGTIEQVTSRAIPGFLYLRYDVPAGVQYTITSVAGAEPVTMDVTLDHIARTVMFIYEPIVPHVLVTVIHEDEDGMEVAPTTSQSIPRDIASTITRTAIADTNFDVVDVDVDGAGAASYTVAANNRSVDVAIGPRGDITITFVYRDRRTASVNIYAYEVLPGGGTVRLPGFPITHTGLIPGDPFTVDAAPVIPGFTLSTEHENSTVLASIPAVGGALRFYYVRNVYGDRILVRAFEIVSLMPGVEVSLPIQDFTFPIEFEGTTTIVPSALDVPAHFTLVPNTNNFATVPNYNTNNRVVNFEDTPTVLHVYFERAGRNVMVRAILDDGEPEPTVLATMQDGPHAVWGVATIVENFAPTTSFGGGTTRADYRLISHNTVSILITEAGDLVVDFYFAPIEPELVEIHVELRERGTDPVYVIRTFVISAVPGFPISITAPTTELGWRNPGPLNPATFVPTPERPVYTFVGIVPENGRPSTDPVVFYYDRDLVRVVLDLVNEGDGTSLNSHVSIEDRTIFVPRGSYGTVLAPSIPNFVLADGQAVAVRVPGPAPAVFAPDAYLLAGQYHRVTINYVPVTPPDVRVMNITIQGYVRGTGPDRLIYSFTQPGVLVNGITVPYTIASTYNNPAFALVPSATTAVASTTDILHSVNAAGAVVLVQVDAGEITITFVYESLLHPVRVMWQEVDANGTPVGAAQLNHEVNGIVGETLSIEAPHRSGWVLVETEAAPNPRAHTVVGNTLADVVVFQYRRIAQEVQVLVLEYGTRRILSSSVAEITDGVSIDVPRPTMPSDVSESHVWHPTGAPTFRTVAVGDTPREAVFYVMPVPATIIVRARQVGGTTNLIAPIEIQTSIDFFNSHLIFAPHVPGFVISSTNTSSRSVYVFTATTFVDFYFEPIPDVPGTVIVRYMYGDLELQTRVLTNQEAETAMTVTVTGTEILGGTFSLVGSPTQIVTPTAAGAEVIFQFVPVVHSISVTLHRSSAGYPLLNATDLYGTGLTNPMAAISVRHGSNATIHAPHIPGFVIVGSSISTHENVTANQNVRFYYIPIEDIIDYFTVDVLVIGQVRNGADIVGNLYEFTIQAPINNALGLNHFNQNNMFTFSSVDVSSNIPVGNVFRTHEEYDIVIEVGTEDFTVTFVYRSALEPVRVEWVEVNASGVRVSAPAFAFYQYGLPTTVIDIRAPHMNGWELVSQAVTSHTVSTNAAANVVTLEYRRIVNQVQLLVIEQATNRIVYSNVDAATINSGQEYVYVYRPATEPVGYEWADGNLAPERVRVYLNSEPRQAVFYVVRQTTTVTAQARLQGTNQDIGTPIVTVHPRGATGVQVFAPHVNGHVLVAATPSPVSVNLPNAETHTVIFYFIPVEDFIPTERAVFIVNMMYGDRLLDTVVIPTDVGEARDLTALVPYSILAGSFTRTNAQNYRLIDAVVTEGTGEYLEIFIDFTPVMHSIRVELINSSTGEIFADADLPGALTGVSYVSVIHNGAASIQAPHIPHFVLASGTGMYTRTPVFGAGETVRFFYTPIEDVVGNYMVDVTVVGVVHNAEGAVIRNLYEFVLPAAINNPLALSSFNANTSNYTLFNVTTSAPAGTFTLDGATYDIRIQVAENNLTVTFIYHQLTMPVRVYVQDGDGPEAYVFTVQGLLGSPITVHAPQRDGWLLVDATPTPHTHTVTGVAATDRVVFQYRRITGQVQVLIVEEGTGRIVNSERTYSINQGSQVTIYRENQILPAGYAWANDTTYVTVQYAEVGQQRRAVFFVRRYTTDVIVRARLQGAEDSEPDLVASTTLTFPRSIEGAPTIVDVAAPHVTGYVLVGTSPRAVTLPNGATSHEVIFEFIPVTDLFDGVIIVEYVCEYTGTILHTRVIDSVAIGSVTNVMPSQTWQDGSYTLVPNQDPYVQMPATGGAITRTFEFAPNWVTVTVRLYNTSTGEFIGESIVHDRVLYGSERTFYAPHVPGYVLTGGVSQVTLNRTSTPQNTRDDALIVFDYTPLEEYVRDNFVAVTILLAEHATGAILGSRSELRPINSSLEVTADTLSGRMLSLTTRAGGPQSPVVTLAIGEESVTHTFYYTSLDGEVTVILRNIETGYELGTFIVGATVGQPLIYRAPVLSGYDFVSVEGQPDTTYAFIASVLESGNTIIFNYRPQPEPLPGEAVVEIIHRELNYHGPGQHRIIFTSSMVVVENAAAVTVSFDDVIDLTSDFFTLESAATQDASYAGPRRIYFDYEKQVAEVTVRAIRHAERGEVDPEILGEEVLVNVRMGEVLAVPVLSVPGYILHADSPLAVRITENPTTIYLYYRDVVDGLITVHLYRGAPGATGNVLIGTQVIEAETGAFVTVNAPDLSDAGYSLHSASPLSRTVQAGQGAGAPVISFYYEINEDAFEEFTVVLINQGAQAGEATDITSLAPGFNPVILVLPGTTQQVFAPHVPGFVLVTAEAHQVHFHNLTGAGRTVYFYYTPLEDYIRDLLVPVTVIGMIYGTTTELYRYTTMRLNTDDITVTHMGVHGYSLSPTLPGTTIAQRPNVTLTPAEEEHIFYYVATSTTVEIVLYEISDGEMGRYNTAATIGEGFSLRHPSLEGFDFIGVIITAPNGVSTELNREVVNGMIANVQVGYTITFVYERHPEIEPDPVNPDPVLVTIVYREVVSEADRTQVAELRTRTLLVAYGSEPQTINAESLAANFFTLVGSSSHTITHADGGQTFYFDHVKQTTTITVRAIDLYDGSVMDYVVLPGVFRLGEVASVNNTGLTIPAGYMLVRPTSPTTVLVNTVDNQYVDFNYQEIEYGIINVYMHYSAPGTIGTRTRLLGTQTIMADFGATVYVYAPVLTGAGYRLIPGQVNPAVRVTSPEGVEAVHFYYTRDDDAFVRFNVELRSNETGELLPLPSGFPAHVYVLRGTTQQVFAPAVEGYVLDDALGVFRNLDTIASPDGATVTFWYTPLEDYAITNRYFVRVRIRGEREDGSVIYSEAERLVRRSDLTAPNSHEVRSMQPPGYALVDIPGNDAVRNITMADVDQDGIIYVVFVYEARQTPRIEEAIIIRFFDYQTYEYGVSDPFEIRAITMAYLENNLFAPFVYTVPRALPFLGLEHNEMPNAALLGASGAGIARLTNVGSDGHTMIAWDNEENRRIQVEGLSASYQHTIDVFFNRPEFEVTVRHVLVDSYGSHITSAPDLVAPETFTAFLGEIVTAHALSNDAFAGMLVNGVASSNVQPQALVDGNITIILGYRAAGNGAGYDYTPAPLPAPSEEFYMVRQFVEVNGSRVFVGYAEVSSTALVATAANSVWTPPTAPVLPVEPVLPETPADEAEGTPADEAEEAPADEAEGTPADEADETPADEAEGTPADEAEEAPADEADETSADEYEEQEEPVVAAGSVGTLATGNMTTTGVQFVSIASLLDAMFVDVTPYNGTVTEEMLLDWALAEGLRNDIDHNFEIRYETGLFATDRTIDLIFVPREELVSVRHYFVYNGEYHYLHTTSLGHHAIGSVVTARPIGLQATNGNGNGNGDTNRDLFINLAFRNSSHAGNSLTVEHGINIIRMYYTRLEDRAPMPGEEPDPAQLFVRYVDRHGNPLVGLVWQNNNQQTIGWQGSANAAFVVEDFDVDVANNQYEILGNFTSDSDLILRPTTSLILREEEIRYRIFSPEAQVTALIGDDNVRTFVFEQESRVHFVCSITGAPLANPQWVVYGSDAVAPANPTRPGYTFAGWSRGMANITGPTVIEALWIPVNVPTVEVTFNYNHQGAPNSTVVTIAQGTRVTQPSNPTRPGFNFAGWYTAPTGGTRFNFNQNINSDVTVYARWTPVVIITPDPVTHVVRFHHNDGTGRITSVTVSSGSTVSPPVSPVRPGYTFMGWFAASGNAFDFNTQIWQDTDLFAHWQRHVIGGGTPPVQPDRPELIPELTPDYDLYSPNFRRHFVHGFPDGSFRPDASLTRAEMMQMFFNISNPIVFRASESRFTDVASDAWYFEAVSYMESRGFIVGFPDGTLRPNQPITNAEFAAMATRFFGLDSLIEADDLMHADHWAANYVNLGFAHGWFDYFGISETFVADAIIPRAQAVALLNFYQGRVPCRTAINEFLIANNVTVYNDLIRGHWSFYEIMEASFSRVYHINTAGEQVWTRVFNCYCIGHGHHHILNR